MKKKRPFWTVRAQLDTNRSHGIEVVYLHFCFAYLQDAQKQANSEYCEASMKSYYQGKANALKQETGHSQYFDTAGVGNEFCVITQRNIGKDASQGGSWYGLRLNSGNLTEGTCKAFKKLIRLDFCANSALAAIDALNARHAVYCDAAEEWIQGVAPDYLKAID